MSNRQTAKKPQSQSSYITTKTVSQTDNNLHYSMTYSSKSKNHLNNRLKLSEEIVKNEEIISQSLPPNKNELKKGVSFDLEKKKAQQSKRFQVKKMYTSRRTKNYEDNDSNGEDGETYDTAVITQRDTQGNITNMFPNPKFKPYKSTFKKLIKNCTICTPHIVVSIIINHGSTYAVAVLKKNEHQSFVQIYCLKTNNLMKELPIGQGKPQQCIKCNELEQNEEGTIFALGYMDDGKFYVKIFGLDMETREFSANERFGIDDWSIAITDFPDPFITCTFLSDTNLFVNFFYTYSQMHCHFIWDFFTDETIGQTEFEDLPVIKQMQCNIKNFPVKCFYNEFKKEIYSFYRQGQSFKINSNDLEQYQFSQVIDGDIGQIVLIEGECLVIQSSSKIMFFVQKKDDLSNEKNWEMYHTIKIRGAIYYMKETDKLQITTNNFIYFYVIDLDTFEPYLQNVMNNYMSCAQMMIDKRELICVAYKQNQKSFDIYQRKYMHDLRVLINDTNLEGSKAIEITSHNLVVATNNDSLILLENKTYHEVGNIHIPMKKTNTREPYEIIGIQKSEDESLIAVVSGKNLIMEEQTQEKLYIFKRNVGHTGKNMNGLFKLHKTIQLNRLPMFHKVCMQFVFKKETVLQNLIFAKKEEIFQLNFETEKITSIYKFKSPFSLQPSYFVANNNQDIFTVASMHDGVWVDLKKLYDIDIDELFNILAIMQVIYDHEDQNFYLLANKKDGNIGFFLIKYDAKNPAMHQFLTMWKSLLEIGDATMQVSRGSDALGDFKELVIGYKTININTYNLVVQCLSGKGSAKSVLQKHESFQLWESKISGLLIEKTKDYLSFSKMGINVVSMGTQSKKALQNAEGYDTMVHSLDSLSFLKVEPLNFINFYCQDQENREVSIEQEWTKCGETNYHQIYKIKINEMTLREALILQSFYLTKNNFEVVSLVQKQPNPRFFYKTFLELDCANMTSVLAFDSGSMGALLGQENNAYFNEQYPIIYKNKIAKKDGKNYFYTNAIDIAIKNNQVKAVNQLIEYIISFQNNYISSYLFTKNLTVIIEKGIGVHSLLQSKVFTVIFDYDDWPANHFNDEKVIRAYSGSIFGLRNNYRKIFHEEDFRPMDQLMKSEFDSTKIRKVVYTINLLMQSGMYIQNDEIVNEDVSLMQLCEETEELEMFETATIQDIIDFKWKQYGRSHHYLGMAMHMLYTLMIIIYVSEAYIHEPRNQQLYTLLLAIGTIYPAYYDFKQLCKLGLTTYFSDLGNYSDCLYIWGSIVNVFLQNLLGPFHIVCKIIMIVIVLQVLLKSFFFLRVYPTLTPIIVMLKTVIYDLRIFMLFYTILIGLFCMVLAVLGLGAEYDENGIFWPEEEDELDVELIDEEAGTYRRFRFLKAKGAGGGGGGGDAENPAKDYQAIGLMAGDFMWTLRLSMGDSAAIEAAKQLAKNENILFWIVWLLITIVTAIIFLNFIVAEASASYTKVTETLELVIWQEQASLILESEDMIHVSKKTSDNFPRSLIIRNVQE